MKRPTKAQSDAAADCGSTDEGFAKRHPQLVQYMTDAKYDDGTPRELSSFTVTMTSGGVQVALNDKEERQSMYSTAGTLAEALKLLEKALADGVDAWRPWKNAKGKKG